ncbi:MAG: exodeoxyribonuclease VII small subunit [Lunatimonas sp.]|uniref:exodeoxyribonuclease VII small subunit n=1 Tax=Lunatimonas sp. TaxID=2060141 RepID=UPI00263A9A8A|nr:exodeoxyribonuclease VII small subunit [Lunatimonas sp.]MCC5935803.1 exodeoxyribonuclease VII small subunit [Lunatimonas sp.]
MENQEPFSYDQAMKRIEEIIFQLEQDDRGIDELAAMVKEASTLVKNCKQKLKDTEETISKAFEEE